MPHSLTLTQLQQAVPSQHRTWTRLALGATAAAYLLTFLASLISHGAGDDWYARSELLGLAVCATALGLERSGRCTAALTLCLAGIWVETHFSLLFSELGARSDTGPGLLAFVIGSALLLGRRWGLFWTLASAASWTMTLLAARWLGTGRGLRGEDAMGFMVVLCAILAVGWLVYLVQGYFEQVLSAARAHARRASALLEQAPDAIVAINASGRVEAFNQRAQQLLNIQPAQIVGNTALDLPLDDNEGHAVSLLDLEPDERPEEITVRHSERVLEASVRQLPDEKGGVGRIVILRDVTARKQAERRSRQLELQLRHAQKMEALGQLAGGVAHDFNNLLAVIGGCTELIMRLGDNEVKALAAQLMDVQQRGSTLTRQLLTFARREPARPRCLELADALEAMLPLLQHLTGPEVQLRLSLSRPCPLLIDPTQLEQLLLNLVANARDAVDDDGVVTLRCQLGEQRVTLVVEDDGAGMTENQLERIFDPFFTTKPEGRGTGLGLSTVHGIVEESAGTVQVESRPGEGTRFTVDWPRASVTDASAQPGGTPPNPSMTLPRRLPDEPTVDSGLRQRPEAGGSPLLLAGERASRDELEEA